MIKRVSQLWNWPRYLIMI